MDERKVRLIQEIIEAYYNLPSGSIQLKTRKREIVQARQMAMAFSKDKTKFSLALIGSLLGGKDHATVLYAKNTVNNLVDSDRQFREDFNEIQKRISNKFNEPMISKEEIYSTITKAVMERFVHYREWNKILKEMVNT